MNVLNNTHTRTAIAATIVALAVLLGGTAQADSVHDTIRQYARFEHADSQRHADKHKHGRYKRRHRDIVRLDIPVHVRGSDTIHLRRLAKRHYDIDLSNYRLRKVVLDNYGRRHASANVRVGHRVTGHQQLNRGRNHLQAPRRGDGRWLLGVRGARIDHIRLVLEPKQRWAYHHGRPQQSRPWF